MGLNSAFKGLITSCGKAECVRPVTSTA